MNIQEWLNDPQNQAWLFDGLLALIGLIVLTIVFRQVKKSNRRRAELHRESVTVQENNQSLTQEIRERLIISLKTQARVLVLHPVVPGNTPDVTNLEGRNRIKCIDLIIADFPRDIKSQGIRMTEFVHHLSDNLFQAYGKDPNTTHLLIESQPIILDAECAIHIGLMLNELISNALQYAPVPGEKTKINIIVKERNEKLFINVADNGIGMKSPYIPKFSFGLQLVNSLVEMYKGEMIINSRPGTRVEIHLNEYKKAEREVFVTPTQRIH